MMPPRSISLSLSLRVCVCVGVSVVCVCVSVFDELLIQITNEQYKQASLS